MQIVSSKSAQRVLTVKQHGAALTWANSAEDKQTDDIFPLKRLWHFMQIISSGDNLHEMLKPIF